MGVDKCECQIFFSSRAQTEWKRRWVNSNSLFFNWKIHLLLPSDISVPNPWAFRLALSLSWFSAIEIRVNYSTSYPSFQQIVRLLNLHNHVNQPLTGHLFPYIALLILLLCRILIQHPNAFLSLDRKLFLLSVN